MVLIIATHALRSLAPDAAPRAVRLALRYALSGTVGFTTVSGMLIGYFAVARAPDLARIHRRYRTQAIRLLLVAHPLIVLALVGPLARDAPAWDYGLRTLYITDVLALLFLAVVPRVHRAEPLVRLGLGVALIVVARLVWLTPVEPGPLLFARDLLCGIGEGERVLLSTYAVLPLAGFFLVGSFVGDRFARAEARGQLDQLGRRFVLAATGLVGLSLALGALWVAGKRGAPVLAAEPIRRLLYPDYHLSLYPAYLGLTLALVGLLVRRRSVGPLQRFFLIFGKTSLFTFVVQYYVVQTLPWALGWEGALSTAELAVFLAAALGVLFAAATLWNRHVKQA
jgi:hypothetical protein